MVKALYGMVAFYAADRCGQEYFNSEFYPPEEAMIVTNEKMRPWRPFKTVYTDRKLK